MFARKITKLLLYCLSKSLLIITEIVIFSKHRNRDVKSKYNNRFPFDRSIQIYRRTSYSAKSIRELQGFRCRIEHYYYFDFFVVKNSIGHVSQWFNYWYKCTIVAFTRYVLKTQLQYRKIHILESHVPIVFWLEWHTIVLDQCCLVFVLYRSAFLKLQVTTQFWVTTNSELVAIKIKS